jgi:hypothetical protein
MQSSRQGREILITNPPPFARAGRMLSAPAILITSLDAIHGITRYHKGSSARSRLRHSQRIKNRSSVSLRLRARGLFRTVDALRAGQRAVSPFVGTTRVNLQIESPCRISNRGSSWCRKSRGLRAVASSARGKLAICRERRLPLAKGGPLARSFRLFSTFLATDQWNVVPDEKVGKNRE